MVALRSLTCGRSLYLAVLIPASVAGNHHQSCTLRVALCVSEMFGSRKLRNSEWHILPDTGARYKWSEKRKKFVFENGDTVPAERVPRSASKQLDYTTDATHLPRQVA